MSILCVLLFIPIKNPCKAQGVLFLMKGIFWLSQKKENPQRAKGKFHRRGDFSRLENGFHKFAVGDDGEFISL